MLAYINDEVIKSANWWLMVANMHVRCMPFWSTSHGQRFRASMLQHPDNAYLLERPLRQAAEASGAACAQAQAP